MSVAGFAAHLRPGEAVLWSGRPTQGLRLTRRDWILVPFSLFFVAVSVTWEALVMRDTQALSLKILYLLFGAAFVLIGLYLLVGRFAVDAWARHGTAYALTNRRILISRSWPFAALIAVSIDRLPAAHLTEGRDGRGTIRFGPPVTLEESTDLYEWTPALDTTPQFIGIENARAVLAEVERASLKSAYPIGGGAGRSSGLEGGAVTTAPGG
jgi:hypothetical protein